MIKLDPVIMEFVGNNILALYIVQQILKGVAKMTKSTVDDKISTMFSNILSGITRGRNVSVAKKESG